MWVGAFPGVDGSPASANMVLYNLRQVSDGIGFSPK